MKMERMEYKSLATQRFSCETEPSKEFKMKLNDIMSEAKLVEYEYQRRRATLSCSTGTGLDAASLCGDVPV